MSLFYITEPKELSLLDDEREDSVKGINISNNIDINLIKEILPQILKVLSPGYECSINYRLPFKEPVFEYIPFVDEAYKMGFKTTNVRKAKKIEGEEIVNRIDIILGKESNYIQSF